MDIEIEPSTHASVVVDMSGSPNARLAGLPVSAVRLADTFWEPRRRVNQEITLPSQYEKCEETGRIDNFRRAADKPGKRELPFQGRYYNDSDVYKWVEAVSFVLAQGDDPKLRQMLDTVVREIADAQQPDGYLNTYFTCERQDQRWTNLKDLHELYCAGHLIQAAVAHHRATEQIDFLAVARRYADYICEVFGPDRREGTCGHQEIELALVELYRLTAEERYLTQARLFIERRGRKPPVIGGSPYHQDHAPFRELSDVVGHAVRMVYYCAGAADVVAETGDAEYWAALERLWDSMVHRRSYVTGGIGSRYEGEAFGGDHELPNDRSYAETCAAIGSVMWNWRMLLITGEARFADAIETALYNAFPAGLSLDGDLYFYQNPLADSGGHRRQPWFECACCPPNIARMLASLPGYLYSTSEAEVWVHLYATSSADAVLPDGRRIRVSQETGFPWDGEVTLRVEPEIPSSFALRLRIPGWCPSVTLEVNGKPLPGPLPSGTYAEIRRDWKMGDSVRLVLSMPVLRRECHPYVTNNAGRVALQRGPLVYCVEEVDLGFDPRDLSLPEESELTAEWAPELLGGVTVLQGPALRRNWQAAWNGDLYRLQGRTVSPELLETELVAVPYYAWANRRAGGMAVWLSTL